MYSKNTFALAIFNILDRVSNSNKAILNKKT